MCWLTSASTLLAILFFCSACGQDSQRSYYWVSAVNGVELKKRGSEASLVVAQMPYRAKVQVVRRAGSAVAMQGRSSVWLEVVYKKKRGWVARAYLTRYKALLDALRTTEIKNRVNKFIFSGLKRIENGKGRSITALFGAPKEYIRGARPVKAGGIRQDQFVFDGLVCSVVASVSNENKILTNQRIVYLALTKDIYQVRHGLDIGSPVKKFFKLLGAPHLEQKDKLVYYYEDHDGTLQKMLRIELFLKEGIINRIEWYK